RILGRSGSTILAVMTSLRGRPGRASAIPVGWFLLERLVGLLLDQARPRCNVDRLLDAGALVVKPIDRARELDERRTEIAARVAVADGVLDLPQLRVHPLELGGEPRKLGDVAEADGTQRRKLARDVLELTRIRDALGLDLEDGDLVDQLA